ncbi:MAG: glycosyltransferase family 2 protein [Kastovskya adunca ATA6-11-RM4]|jgi:GT2 family glycosyltransferase|nr:glycosyltransferase family 2 protein [Kastovskya adunca ATA6-11-RM4]
MNRDRIAALLTCHNRRQNTLDSLTALFNQELNDEATLDVYLVDDGSTDGTAEAVHQAYPQVKILPGDGSLFWNGGMRQAFAAAMQQDYGYYLWLNDDTILYPKAVSNLFTALHKVAEQGEERAIIAGSTRDASTGQLTYGGVVQRSWWRPTKFDLVEPGEQPKRCDTINGNFVLIPRNVVQVVGNLDPVFTHYAGDWDYGLRAKKQGCSVWIAPGYVGTCSQNYQPGKETSAHINPSEGFKKITQPKGFAIKDQTLHPLGEWKVFAQRHGGFLWPIYWLIPYRRLLRISLFGQLQRE